MEISFSEIQAYQRCPRKYYYGSVMKLQRKAVALPLAQGIMVHRMMQGFYMDGSLGLEAEVDVMVAEYQDNPFVLDDDLVTFEDLMMESEALVEAYLEYYDEDRGWEVLHVEEQFSIELGRHTITFTPDLIVRDASGQVWIVDHKTAASLPDPGVPFGELQAMMYLAAVRDLYPEVAGFIFNYIRKKRPRVPRLNKTAPYHVSDLNRIDTTYEVLRDWLTVHAPVLLYEPRHQKRLAELKGNNKFFHREYVLTTPLMEDIQLTDTERWAELVAKDTSYMRVYGNKLFGIMSCKRCPYQALCQGELLNWDTDRIILEQYEPRDLSHKDYETDDAS